MKIESTTGGIHIIDGKRKRINKKLPEGTTVTVKVNWSMRDIEEIDNMIRLIIVPAGVTLDYHNNDGNAGIINQPEYLDSTEEKLRTTLFSDGAMRPTTRLTKVDIYKLHKWQDTGWIYELGIPIQGIECPYNVDVNQKVPMNTNRDTVRDAYLKDIYALVLNLTANDLDEDDVSETWVHTATEDELTSDETVKIIHDKRYGDSVLYSSDHEANERAREAGKEIIHSRFLSKAEKDRFKSSGLVSASVNFGLSAMHADSIHQDKWTDGMIKLADLTKWLSTQLDDKQVSVRFIRERKIVQAASYGNNTITYNLAKFGKPEPPFEEWVIGTIIHELSHRQGSHFEMRYINHLSRMAGRAVRLALHNTKTFKKKTGA